MKTLGAVLLGLGLLVGSCGLAWAYAGSGFTYYGVGVPAGKAITVNGDLGDWDWFPDAATIGIEDACYVHACQIETDEHLGTPNCEVNTADFDWTIKVAWAPEPDNRIYFAVEVYDDVWMFPETAGERSLHKWDDLELVTDPDNSGGTAGSTTDDEGYSGRYGQQWYCSAGAGGTELRLELIYIGVGMVKEATWMDVPPYAEFNFKKVGNTGYYEGAVALFDFLDPSGPEASVRHLLTEGEAIGLGFLYDEHDHSTQYDGQWKTHSGTSSWKTADEIPDFVLLAAPVAVEPSSWGQIKSLFR